MNGYRERECFIFAPGFLEIFPEKMNLIQGCGEYRVNRQRR
ncbi:hypothetical protein AMURIS_02165 [Acetatifactor muris]|uniref:Uncharacterized protein n=1 Tax=Acetatifactor muris TaxID=879566 RepID=A0A2K4ZG57_9FIRM|nr:hypothetical protein AMURIS_02165 [Acetatifactor muris]